MPVSEATARELAGTRLAASTSRATKNPDQLKLFFDQPMDYYRSFRRSASPATSMRSGSGNWGVEDRFNVTHTPNLATMSRPVITVGARVTELERRNEPLFGGQVPAPRTQFCSTVEQQDLGIAGDPKSGLPEWLAKLEGSNELVMKQPEGFANMVMQGPKFEVQAFPQVDRAVLVPGEQRKIMEHIRDRDRAHHVKTKALAAKAKMVQTIKHNYPKGILQVDTPATDSTELYASAREKMLSQQRSRSSHSRERRSHLEHEQNRHGREILHHSDQPDSTPQRPKLRVKPQPNTFNRVFGNDCASPPHGDPFDPNQNSRYQYAGDRTYDVISGKMLPHARAKPRYAQFPETLYM